MIGPMMAAMGAHAASTASPLGRFADIVTALVSVFAIAAAILSHLGLAGVPNSFVDTIALVAVGVLYGTARGYTAGKDDTTVALAERGNLNTALALAAHERLDKIQAPATTLQMDATGLPIGNPADGQAGPKGGR